MTYLSRQAVDARAEVVQRMVDYAGRLPRDAFRGAALCNTQYAAADYAWVDLLVASPLHQLCFRILHAGVEKLPNGCWSQKQALQLAR